MVESEWQGRQGWRLIESHWRDNTFHLFKSTVVGTQFEADTLFFDT